MTERQSAKGCLWPMWAHDAQPNHEYCGRRRAPASSYCERHKMLSVRGSETAEQGGFVPRKAA